MCSAQEILIAPLCFDHLRFAGIHGRPGIAILFGGCPNGCASAWLVFGAEP